MLKIKDMNLNKPVTFYGYYFDEYKLISGRIPYSESFVMQPEYFKKIIDEINESGDLETITIIEKDLESIGVNAAGRGVDISTALSIVDLNYFYLLITNLKNIPESLLILIEEWEDSGANTIHIHFEEWEDSVVVC